MHIQIVNFNINGPTDAEFRGICDQIAPAFAEVPGLISKVWLADAETNTYGGVYTWVDRTAMEAFARSELFESVVSNPALANLASRDFGVMEGPSRVTRGLATATVAA